jgi:hypothetical protein
MSVSCLSDKLLGNELGLAYLSDTLNATQYLYVPIDPVDLIYEIPPVVSRTDLQFLKIDSLYPYFNDFQNRKVANLSFRIQLNQNISAPKTRTTSGLINIYIGNSLDVDLDNSDLVYQIDIQKYQNILNVNVDPTNPNLYTAILDVEVLVNIPVIDLETESLYIGINQKNIPTTATNTGLDLQFLSIGLSSVNLIVVQEQAPPIPPLIPELPAIPDIAEPL